MVLSYSRHLWLSGHGGGGWGGGGVWGGGNEHHNHNLKYDHTHGHGQHRNHDHKLNHTNCFCVAFFAVGLGHTGERFQPSSEGTSNCRQISGIHRQARPKGFRALECCRAGLVPPGVEDVGSELQVVWSCGE